MRWQDSDVWCERAQTRAAGTDILRRIQECDVSIRMFLVLKRMTEFVANQICGPCVICSHATRLVEVSKGQKLGGCTR